MIYTELLGIRVHVYIRGLSTVFGLHALVNLPAAANRWCPLNVLLLVATTRDLTLVS